MRQISAAEERTFSHAVRRSVRHTLSCGSSSGWSEVNYPHIATSSTYGHWVCVAGISPTADPENLTESDFYALDPARVTANGRLAVTRLLDHTLWVENSPLKVLG